MSDEIVGFLSVGAMIWLVQSLVYALIFWATARFVIQERVRFWSCLLAATLGVLLGLCGIVLVLVMLPANGVGPLASSVAAILTAFLLGALANRLLLRTETGETVTFDQACRVQLAPVVVSVVLSASINLFGVIGGGLIAAV